MSYTPVNYVPMVLHAGEKGPILEERSEEGETRSYNPDEYKTLIDFGNPGAPPIRIDTEEDLLLIADLASVIPRLVLVKAELYESRFDDTATPCNS